MSKQIEDAMVILRERGITLDIGGCGCCGSPWVKLSVDGQPIIADADGGSVDEVTFQMHEDPE